MSSANAPEKEVKNAPQKKKRPLLLRCVGWFFKVLALLIVLVLLVVAGGGYWLLQTGSGQGFMVSQANKFLDGGAPNGKMRFHITHLSGSLPFTINLGLEALDDKGVFLRAPDNKFVWNWRELPKCVKIEKLALTDATLLRLPDLPPTPEPEPKKDEKPLTFDDIRAYIGQGAEFLAKPPSWMPKIDIGNVALVNAAFPQSLLGAENADAEKNVMDAAGTAEKTAAGTVGNSGANANAESVAEMLRADAELALGLDKSGVKIKADARLANEAGKTVNVPDFSFETANVGLEITAKPENDGLGAHVGLNAALDEPVLGVADMPRDLLGERTSLELGLDARAVCPDYGPAQALELALAGPALDAGRIQVKGQGGWKSGPGFADGKFDGPLNLKLKLDLANGAPEAKDLLAMLHAPLDITFDVSGEPDKPNLNLAVACADIEASGHSVQDLKLNLGGRELVLPIGENVHAADETRLDLKLSGSLDKHNLACNTGLFYKPEGDMARDFVAGLRDLDLLAAGVQGRGDVSARMRDGQKPALDGALKLKVIDWDALSALLPGSKLDGDARIDVDLASNKGVQGANVEIEVPRFSMVSGKEKLVALRGLGARVGLADVFAKPAIDAKINLENADAAGMHFGAKVAASGPIAGPLEARVESTGSVASKVDARWEPGKADINSLDVRMEMPPIGNPGGKAVTLGVRSARPMKITYGDGGIGVGDVDLAIIPAGRLVAKGGLSSQKLDLDVNLSGVAFKPWKALLAQLPEGGAELSANLKGTPQRPHGNFRFGLNEVKVPNVPLAPITMALVGAIEPSGGNGGILTAKLELPQKTVQALGGTRADVNARLPLTFGSNGIPAPDMKGPLAAHVIWNGALGPLWKLVPVADMRLNGRINMNVEAAGSMSAPRVHGGINIENGRYENVAVGVLLTQINAKLNLTDAGGAAKGGLPGAMQLDMSATDGRGGNVTVNGGGSLSGDNLNVKAKINSLRPLRRRDVFVELSGGATVSGSAAAPVVVGEIIVDKGEVLLDNIAMGASSVTTLPITTPETIKAAEEKAAAKKAAAEKNAKNPGQATGQGSLNVKINMPPRFSVEGRGLTSLWEANMLVSGTPADPAITGNVSCFKGNFDFLGKNFVLTRGTVTFAGGSLSNPLLDIELTNETPDLTAHLLITGPVNKMKLSLTSDPSLPQDDILSKVLFGRSSNELTRLEALQLAGAVAQLSGFTGNGSSIFQIGKKALGLDVLRLGSSSADSGEPGDTTASGTTLEAGKYINDWIYMGVQQGMKPDSTAFVIDLELTPHSNIELKTDQSNTWGGYKWKYNY